MSKKKIKTEYRIRENINTLGKKSWSVFKVTMTPTLFGKIKEEYISVYDENLYHIFYTLQEAVKLKHIVEETDELIKKQKSSERWITQNEEIAGSI